jgi:hypothetical protein
VIRRLLALALLLPTLAWADYASTVLADSPKYYWHLGDTSGNAINSGTTAGLADGTYTGGFTRNQTGIPGYAATNGAVVLNGTTGYVTAADTGGSLNINSGNGDTYTAEMWVYPTQSTNHTVPFVNGIDASPDRMQWQLALLNTGTFQFLVYADGGTSPACQGNNYGLITAVGSWSVNNWYHIVATTGTTAGALDAMRLYVNGTLLSTQSSFSGAPCFAGTDRVDIGRRFDNSLYFQGTVDEAAIYNVVGGAGGRLSQTQVTTHYNCGITAGCGIATSWPFTVERPALPSFMDDGYFAKAARRGYHTGRFAAREPLPQYLTVGYLPFQVMPSGARGR